jgi:hypothetical protein
MKDEEIPATISTRTSGAVRSREVGGLLDDESEAELRMAVVQTTEKTGLRTDIPFWKTV